MSKNIDILVPSSYQIQVGARTYAEDRINYEMAVKYRCPNFLHKNGKIHASKIGEPYVAVTVSPYHDKFQSQIEEPVWPVVKGLVDKGYLPVSSCGGHTDPWWEYYFMLAVGTEEQVRFHHEPFALFFNPFNIFASHFFHKKEIEEFEIWKNNLLNYIENEIDYFYG